MLKFNAFNYLLTKKGIEDNIIIIALNNEKIQFKLKNIEYGLINKYEWETLLIEDNETLRTYLINMEDIQYVELDLDLDLKSKIRTAQNNAKNMLMVNNNEDKIKMEI